MDGFTVELTGDLFAGSPSQLILRVTKGGQPVTTLQPYLGAFGHLVALRDGDLAYLHVHPHGDEPAAHDLAGPTIEFAAEPPTPGRYLLYLDFQVDQQVHTAPFIADAASGPDRHGAHAASHAPQVQTHAQPGTGTSAGALGRGHSH